MIDYLLLAAGAVVGGPSRYLIDRLVQWRWRHSIPSGTLTVNLIGSGILGFIPSWPPTTASPVMVVAVGAGFCGALTTYSTFAYETVRLLQAGRRRQASVNVLITVLGCAAAAGIGTGIAALLR